MTAASVESPFIRNPFRGQQIFQSIFQVSIELDSHVHTFYFVGYHNYG